MKPYKLNFKVIIGIVGILSLLIFSAVLVLVGKAKVEGLGELLLHYGLIIAPVSVLWYLLDHYLWYTTFFQAMRKSLNIPPDLQGRWEGTLENADGSKPQKFVIEVTQTLTNIKVHSFSSLGHSTSILTEIGADSHEDNFMIGYLWQGEINTSIKDMHQGVHFYGYTMLYLHEKETPKVLKGSYFTNLKPNQTRGGIQMQRISKKLMHKFE